MAQTVRFDIADAGHMLATQARRDLAALPPAERRRIESVLGSNRDGRGRCGLVISTPTGAGRRR